MYRERERVLHVYVCMCIYIYIYIGFQEMTMGAEARDWSTFIFDSSKQLIGAPRT